jgi:AcrR family transcriptional regulator
MNQSFIGSDQVPRTEAANQRIRAQQRANILDGARTVFARKGLAATMAEVAAAAGISQGLAYRYFANKDELFRALVEDAMQSSEAPSLLEMPGTPGARLSFLVWAFVKSRREHPEFFQLLDHVMSDPATPADLVELVHGRGRRFMETLRQLIVEGQATAEVAGDDPDQLMTAVIACLDGLSRLAARDPERTSHFPDAEIVMRMLRAPAKEEGK